MKSPTRSHREIILELTEDQSRQIERASGKLVTELEIEIVEAAEQLEGSQVELLTTNEN